MNTFPHPLRLATGSHEKGSGKGCAMNVISYENGDAEITDYPACADRFLAKLVQHVNDTYCDHTDGDGMLCAPCSVEVLALAHRTTGTALDGWDGADVAKVYVTLAVEQAESVLHLTSDEAPRRAVALVRRSLAGEPVATRSLVAAADAAAAYAAAYAADAAAYAAYAAAYAAAAYAVAVDDAAHAANAANRLQRAHHIIDRFETLTGIRAQPVDPETTRHALALMETT